MAPKASLLLEKCLNEWVEAARPPLSKILFRASVAAATTKLETWLTQPPTAPFLITADLRREALAFVACALETYGKFAGAFYDLAIILRTAEALKRATATAPAFVAIAASPEVELASAGIQETHHLLIIRRRNDISGEPDLALDLVDDKTYREALTEMGLPEQTSIAMPAIRGIHRLFCGGTYPRFPQSMSLLGSQIKRLPVN